MSHIYCILVRTHSYSSDQMECVSFLSHTSAAVCCIPVVLTCRSSVSSHTHSITITSSHNTFPDTPTDIAVISSHFDTDAANDESTSFSSFVTSNAVLRPTTVQTVDLPGRLHQVTCSTMSPCPSKGMYL